MDEPINPAYAISWDTILSVIKRRKYLGEKPVEELSVEDLQALKPLLIETLDEHIDGLIEETIDIYELELNL
jgi:hypothetical protein